MEKLKGIYKRRTKSGKDSFIASFTFRRKHISLGSFNNKIAASLAYKEALSIVDRENITIDSYSEASFLPFEKWIIILNFRDNGIYLRNPIYLRKYFFEYYLNKDEIMKFDKDDLFFYSTHKIMKRGGHLFFSDYGMQTNLLHRYGIRSFAVKDRDYVFLNGDPLDFRYDNIKIINKYFGVTLEKSLPKPIFLAKINVKGSIVIGRFNSEITAAIAYNKAVDTLVGAGINKKYEINYISELSHSEYDRLYNEIRFSKSFLKFLKMFTIY